MAHRENQQEVKAKGELGAREAASRELRLQEHAIEQPTHRPIPPGAQVAHLVDEFLALPRNAQLGALRTITSRVFGELNDEERAGFMRDLNEDIGAAEDGQETYDVRHLAPTYH